MVTVAFDLPGFWIARNLSVVRGVVVRAVGVTTAVKTAVQGVFAGPNDRNLELYAQMTEQARGEAHMRMLQHAAGTFSANAVIGVRYETNMLGDGTIEVLAYGAAVWAELRR